MLLDLFERTGLYVFELPGVHQHLCKPHRGLEIMGSGYSQEDYNRISLEVYNRAFQDPCLLPDVGIDESLLKYSGLDSNSVLQTYFNELASVPDYIEKLGSSFASLNSIPNAVGLGALVISMIIEICMTRTSSDDSYSMLRRVFGQEKASAVRDTVSTYLWRHQMVINNEQHLREELARLEPQLSEKLNILKNSLLHDEQMSSRGFKIWVNGASFHLQMLIHKARLSTQTNSHGSDVINRAIYLYLQDLDKLLKKYKTYKISTITTSKFTESYDVAWTHCIIENSEGNCENRFTYFHSIFVSPDDAHRFCNPGFFSNTDPKMVEAFMDHVFSKYEPITGLKSHFTNIKKNLNSLIKQHDTFFVPLVAKQ